MSGGITHIEDLSVSNFLEIIENLDKCWITEKVDGAQILFGIDENGFYTSRETKGGTRIYDASIYHPDFFRNTYIRAAHAALRQILPSLESAGLAMGDQVEAEVLYGELPNAVPYSTTTNYIIFLRTTAGDVDIDSLKLHTEDLSITIRTCSPTTKTGKTIEINSIETHWKITSVPKILIDKIDISDSIKSVYNFLDSPCDDMPLLTNRDILNVRLNKCPDWCIPSLWKDTKQDIKKYKTIVIDHFYKHKLEIKELLLDKIVRGRPSLLNDDNFGWIEGLVLTHNEIITKLVDKEVFLNIKDNIWYLYNILFAGAKSIDSTNLSLFAELRLNMATLLGHPELGTLQSNRYRDGYNGDMCRDSSDLDYDMVYENIMYEIVQCHEKLTHMYNVYSEKGFIVDTELNEIKNLPDIAYLKQYQIKRFKEDFASGFYLLNEYSLVILQSCSVMDLFELFIKV